MQVRLQFKHLLSAPKEVKYLLQAAGHLLLQCLVLLLQLLQLLPGALRLPPHLCVRLANCRQLRQGALFLSTLITITIHTVLLNARYHKVTAGPDCNYSSLVTVGIVVVAISSSRLFVKEEQAYRSSLGCFQDMASGDWQTRAPPQRAHPPPALATQRPPPAQSWPPRALPPSALPSAEPHPGLRPVPPPAV